MDQFIRIVRDNAIHSNLEKVFHLFLGIECPDQNFNPLLPSPGGIGKVENLSAAAQNREGVSSGNLLGRIPRLVMNQSQRKAGILFSDPFDGR